MKLLGAFLLLVAAAVSPDIRYFHYQRPIENTPQQSAQTCVALDAALFAHAAAGLADLRLYRDRQETPYVMHMSSPATAPEQAVQLLNLGARGGQTVFDAAMPDGSYSDLALDVKGHDFIATATVTGSQQQAGPITKVGDYTLFDLTRQRLGRSTVLHLPPSDFRYLHIRIAGPVRPEAIAGMTVQQLPSGEPAYAVVAESKQVRLKDHTSVVEFTVPAHVPVDRIAILPGPTPANFSRDATIEVRPIVPSRSGDAAGPSAPIIATGNLLRVHTVEDNHRLDQEHLQLNAPQANFDWPSKWTITIDNGDNAPLLPDSVRLEMVKRNLCFEAGAGKYALYYGDARLSAPRYDLGQFLVVRVKDAAQASTGPEQPNPEYQPRPDDRPFTERHPLLLWIVLALVIFLLGGIAFRTAKTTRPGQR